MRIKPATLFVRFYGTEWTQSFERWEMTLLERCVFMDLLWFAVFWGSMPANPEKLANLAAVSLEDLNKAWPVVGKHFRPDPDDPESLVAVERRQSILERIPGHVESMY